MLKILQNTLWLFAFTMLCQPLPAEVSQPKSAKSVTAPHGLVWDAAQKEGRPNPGETSIVFIFSVTNFTSEVVTIARADVSCGCTKIEFPTTPWKLPPNESGILKVHFDGQGKRGSLTKTILVHSSVGAKTLTVRANLPEPQKNASGENERTVNQQTSLANRQAVFLGKCAVCHATPSRNKTGESLFVAACGICHSAQHRASMVPDLKTLKVTTSKAFWEHWIRNGKSESLMPAFEQKQGGPLTEEQVSSLVEFLSSSKEFSGNATNSLGNPPKP